MTELDFLLELLLNHKIQKVTQTAIKERIALIQSNLGAPRAPQPRPIANGQAPSMQAAIAAMEAEIPQSNSPIPPGPIEPPAPTTAAAARALQSRQDAINAAINQKTEPGRTSPRKF